MRMTRAEVEEFRELRRKEGRLAAGQFLLEGWRALSEATPSLVESIAVHSELVERPELAPLRERGVPIKTLSERDLARISATEHSQGVVAKVRMPENNPAALFASGDALWLALDRVADPGNLGTILRAVDWFGAAGVLLGRGCVDPFNEKVVRATAGSLFHVPIVSELDLAAKLRDARSAKFEIAVTAMDGKSVLGDWRPGRRCVVVLGSEAHGVSPDVQSAASTTVRIPRFGLGESLNVAIAAGIMLAHCRMRS